MAWYVTLAIGLAILVGLFMTGAPIFLAFLIIIVSGVLFILGDAGFGMVINSIYQTATTGSLGTVPLFVMPRRYPNPDSVGTGGLWLRA